MINHKIFICILNIFCFSIFSNIATGQVNQLEPASIPEIKFNKNKNNKKKAWNYHIILKEVLNKIPDDFFQVEDNRLYVQKVVNGIQLPQNQILQKIKYFLEGYIDTEEKYELITSSENELLYRCEETFKSIIYDKDGTKLGMVDKTILYDVLFQVKPNKVRYTISDIKSISKTYSAAKLITIKRVYESDKSNGSLRNWSLNADVIYQFSQALTKNLEKKDITESDW